jgi:hypothetical protein
MEQEQMANSTIPRRAPEVTLDARGGRAYQRGTDLLPAGLGEIASVLARGFLRHRRSLRRQMAAIADVGGSAAPVSNGLAFRADPSRHVTVVNAQREDEN